MERLNSCDKYITLFKNAFESGKWGQKNYNKVCSLVCPKLAQVKNESEWKKI
jgi:hypothetical protein